MLLRCLAPVVLGSQLIAAQEASSGVDLRATFTAQALASEQN